ncbi:MAG: hypothetical protein NXI12_11725 [Alphaproteobacteria bacterium]|nr:hypothetical protein [Alphaproteobacteria bacterium]
MAGRWARRSFQDWVRETLSATRVRNEPISGAARLLLRGGARYIARRPPSPRRQTGTALGDTLMAAIIALALAFGIFGLLNLIDYKRLD